MPLQKKAVVLTGDVIKSSGYSAQKRRSFQNRLNKLYTTLLKLYPDIQLQQYRGDSLQIALTTSRKYGLHTGLQVLSNLAANSIHLRMAIGVGNISFKSKDVVTSDGSAFRASGPYLDALKKDAELISIAGEDENFTSEWQVHSATLNYLMQKWSTQQAEAIYIQLSEQNATQTMIAKKLKISQPSVHQRLQLAGWPVVEKIIQRFEVCVLAQ